ncbi:DUF4219 domain-containing protein [Senna tora]|uniref:DUF4219 domain-containing protein n=1 Tax=Senna tora TaxID=362788 RepID=A0A834WVE0_9FABA|nr:DUF4219 domain-containing protein [Senna tora]
MENQVILGEGQSFQSPPLFEGKNYAYWKNMITIFIQAFDEEIWNIIEEGPKEITKEIDGVKQPNEGVD